MTIYIIFSFLFEYNMVLALDPGKSIIKRS